MKNLYADYALYFRNKRFLTSLCVAVVLLTGSFVINISAINYATRSASNSVTDIILSNVPVVNVDDIFVWGTLFVVLFSVAVILVQVQKIPFALKTLCLFILIRSLFTILTHVGPFPTETERTSYDFLNKLLFGADSFFSGHTGMPFLGALVFWRDTVVRYIYLFATGFFAIVVLLGHLHYSIDVLSAFFITYTIYHIAEVAFKRDKEVFDHGITTR